MQFEHQNHNSRINVPPPASTFVDPFTHPIYVNIRFPRNDYVFMIHHMPSLETLDPRLRNIQLLHTSTHPKIWTWLHRTS